MASRYDLRMLEINRQRAEHAAQAGLERIAASTETINWGMSNPVVWLLAIGGILGVPFLDGLSLGR